MAPGMAAMRRVDFSRQSAVESGSERLIRRLARSPARARCLLASPSPPLSAL